MLCPTPKSIPRPNGKGNADRLSVPCGDCAFCRKRRREDWTIRLLEEAKNHINTVFVTLTYNDEHVKDVNKREIQLFLKKLRKQTPKISYYCVAEYGTKTYRPHYHLIIFGINKSYENKISECWNMGNIYVGTVTIQSISYVCKYHVNKSKNDKTFCLMSKRPAIGLSYVSKNDYYHRDVLEHAFYSDNQFKKPLPRFYKNKLYSDKQRKQIVNQFQDEKDRKSILEISNFMVKNPNTNYFLLQQTKIADFENRFRNKTNYNDKL